MKQLTFREQLSDIWLTIKNETRFALREIRWAWRVVSNRLFGKTYVFEFREFLTTGRLGPVELDMNQTEVFRLMGKPRSSSISEATSSIYHAIHLYGDFEVYVLEPYSDDLPIGSNASVKSIRLSMRRKQIRPPYNFRTSGFLPGWDTTLKDFEGYLKRENIAYSLNKIHFEERFSIEKEWHIDIRNSTTHCFFIERENVANLDTMYSAEGEPMFLTIGSPETIYEFAGTTNE